MKRISTFIIVGFFVLLAGPLLAQPAITLEAFGGWLWTGQAGYNNSIRVDDKGNYGARFGVSPSSDLLVEFEWNHTETTLRWFTTIGGDQVADATMNYYMLGINRQLSEGPAVPYGLFNLGVMNLKGNTQAGGTTFNENFFTAGLGGGIKYYFVDKLGIRLQARLLLPMQFAGLGLGCGTGGCGGGVSTYTSTIQGDFTGGVILKLGN